MFFGSFRGQWIDILLSLAPLATAAAAIIGHRRRIHASTRIYFAAFIALNLLATPAYLFGTICFSLPAFDRLGPYELRERPCILNPKAVIVLKGYGPFERQLTGNLYLSRNSGTPALRLTADSLWLMFPQDDARDTAINICRY